MRAPSFVLLASAIAVGCDGAPAMPTPTDASADKGALDVADDLVVIPDGGDASSDRIVADAPTDNVAPADVAPSGPCTAARGTGTASTDAWMEDGARATVTVSDPGACQRTYTLTSTAPLRDNQPANPRRVTERDGAATVRTRNDLFDALYALAQDEARENSVTSIRDGAFNEGMGIDCPAGGCFETGRLWTYVWTRDTSYAVHLGLAGFDPTRARNSLEFKLSERRGGGDLQVVQDTGTGGSYPVSTDRVVWALGAWELLKYLDDSARAPFRTRAYEALRNTIEHDRAVAWDAADGLYRGEHSFLDWREQSYPPWTATDTAHIAMSKSLSTNVLHYNALDVAARLAEARSDAAAMARYRAMADALRTAIRGRFWDAEARQFRAFATTGLDPAPVARWDLLGTSLAVLTGVADDTQARAAVETYPHAGRGGAAVLWPQQQFTAVYHNRAMWPFVTAYALRAARAVRNDAVVNRDVAAMMRAAALNLSNMENLEFITGAPRVEEGATSGPVVNSQRQLWSVAGFLSMVHDVVFGLDASQEGLRWRPYITRTLRNTTFANADSLVLNDFAYKGARVTVVVNLPPRSDSRAGAYAVGTVRLDGRDVGDGYVTRAMLQARSTVEVTLVDTPEAAATMREVSDTTQWRALFGPRTPAITRVDADDATGQLTLSLDRGGEEPADIRYNVYRLGQRVASDLPGTTQRWMDPMRRDGSAEAPCYVVETVFVTTGTTSQRSLPVCWWGRDGHLAQSVYAYDFANTGGTASNTHGRYHFDDWGDAGHSLTVGYLRPFVRGDHLLQLIAGNGSGGFTTGVTAAVKRVRVQELPAGTDVATGYVVMAQTGSWDEWRGSTYLRATLDPARSYRVVVDSDNRAVNMSSFAHFERYTGGTGGRGGAFNRVNISELRVLPLGAPSGAGSTVTLGGTADLDAYGTSSRITPGVPSASTDAVAVRFDDAYLYATARVSAMGAGELRPYVLYLQTRGASEMLPAVASRAGLTYFDQAAGVPFEADWAIVLRRRSDAGDGAGPYNGLFRWDGTRWVRAMRFRTGVDAWIGTDSVSVRIPRAALGTPARVRLAGHCVQAAGLYNATIPATHQPWMLSRTTGYYELELSATTPASMWTPR